ncbi:MAG: glycerate kinase [Pseudomonadota bacterium]
MKVLIACDKFRGSLTAAEANAIIARAAGDVMPGADLSQTAIADGGEGTAEALSGPTTTTLTADARDAYGAWHRADFVLDAGAQRAVIELAAVAGHPVAASAGYHPHRATTLGVGDLIRAALDAGARDIVVALGGSITVDAGAGALEALGARFVDSAGAPVHAPAGRTLATVADADLSQLDGRLDGATITIAADVDNPLSGPRGAAPVFGPQKGLSAAEIDETDAALCAFDAVLARARGRAPLNTAAYAGAAGGVLVGLSAATTLVARDGFDLVRAHHNLDAAVATVDLVVTGEGSVDAQSIGGKGPIGLARLAKGAGTPAMLLAGRVGVPMETLAAEGVCAAFPLVRGPARLEDAIAGAAEGLYEVSRAAFGLVAAVSR